uniref:ATP synthase protein 8 n=1 Tax=Candida gigantensis TaxID=271359 RepID=S5U682_9ASCO|nr:ATP synthase F0 subunit 8 [Candida gigantensis]AGS44591.1 ATP synthase F0 subunit 8 [Candida gigantensis]
MPQLVPFYWMNLLTTGIAAFSAIVYISSTTILPNVLRLLLARAIVVKV